MRILTLILLWRFLGGLLRIVLQFAFFLFFLFGFLGEFLLALFIAVIRFSGHLIVPLDLVFARVQACKQVSNFAGKGC